MKWFYADSHYGHYNIALHCMRIPWLYPNPKYDPNKPYHFKYNHPWCVDLNRHNTDLMQNWNTLVAPKDEVIIAGDFAYNRHKHFITSLNGKKILIKGNHDKSSADFYGEFVVPNTHSIEGGLDKTPMGEEMDESPLNSGYGLEVRKECHSALKRFKNGDIDMETCATYILSTVWARFLELNDWASIDQMSKECYNNFSEVHEMGCRKSIEGEDVTICHYAMRTWASSFHGSLLAYGHSHGRMPEFDNMMACDIGVDVWGYAPVPWDAFLRKMEIRREWIKKHGKYPVDGENKAEGQYSKDPDQRVVEIRMQNKEIMRSLGYPINDKMWPTEILKLPRAA